MPRAEIELNQPVARVVGCFGSAGALRGCDFQTAAGACDVAEIRLDILAAELDEVTAREWSALAGIPLLFTARRQEEGGHGSLSAERRAGLLALALADASLIDIEVASIGEMAGSIAAATAAGVPWIASFHDFSKLPSTSTLEEAASRAKDAGAAAFKAAAYVHSPADISRLAEFQLADHGLPVATMGMGPLAAVSRLLCAQSGSVLNYGFIGTAATAPGQWESAFLKQAIARTAPFRA